MNSPAWASETPLCKFPREKVLVHTATNMKASGGRKFGELVELGFSCFPVMLCRWIREKRIGP